MTAQDVLRWTAFILVTVALTGIGVWLLFGLAAPPPPARAAQPQTAPLPPVVVDNAPPPAAPAPRAYPPAGVGHE